LQFVPEDSANCCQASAADSTNYACRRSAEFARHVLPGNWINMTNGVNLGTFSAEGSVHVRWGYRCPSKSAWGRLPLPQLRPLR